MKKYNLDGIYFRIKRDNKWENICFSDLTNEERYDIMKDKDAEYLKRVCNELANVIYDIGTEFNIRRE